MKDSKQKKTVKKEVSKPESGFWITVFFLMATVIGLSAFIIYMFWHSHRELGQFGISDVYPGKNLHTSLDLKLAAKAKYPSSAIEVVNDLGVTDSISQKVISFEVKNDNLVEYGLIMQPAGDPPPGGYPVLILIHGYVDPQNYVTDLTYLNDMRFYAQNGFLVIKPDLRGHGESVKAGHADSAYYSMSYNTDILSLVSALKQTKYVDQSNISIWGHSMGAYIALRAAVISGDIKNIILLSSPVDTLEKMYLTYLPPSDINNPYALATRVEVFSKYGTPAENQRFWYDASPINFVNKIRANVQIHIGLLDGIVPPSFSVNLNEALNKTKVSHQYYEYAQGSHSLVESRQEIYARSLEVLLPENENSPKT